MFSLFLLRVRKKKKRSEKLKLFGFFFLRAPQSKCELTTTIIIATVLHPPPLNPKGSSHMTHNAGWGALPPIKTWTCVRAEGRGAEGRGDSGAAALASLDHPIGAIANNRHCPFHHLAPALVFRVQLTPNQLLFNFPPLSPLPSPLSPPSLQPPPSTSHPTLPQSIIHIKPQLTHHHDGW